MSTSVQADGKPSESQPAPSDAATSAAGGVDASAAGSAAEKWSHVQPISEIKKHDMIVFDSVNQKYLQTSSDPAAIVMQSFDGEGQPLDAVDVSSMVCPENAVAAGSALAGEEAQTGARYVAPASESSKDNMSILRFDATPPQFPKGPAVRISDCGFQVTVVKKTGKDTKKKTEKQLVLTNMAFSSGVHVWEVICPISCQDIYVGAYNPLTKASAMETFYNTTPRSIFICLDLNKNEMKFWLNEHKLPHKSLNILESAGASSTGPGQQWVPAIKIGREGNQAILNPFPYIPFDFNEDVFDRNFEYHKALIPHLLDTICVTQLPKESTGSPDDVMKYLNIAKEQLTKISLFNQDSDVVCFLKFSSQEAMHAFAEYHKSDIKASEGEAAKSPDHQPKAEAQDDKKQIDSSAAPAEAPKDTKESKEAKEEAPAPEHDYAITIHLPPAIIAMFLKLDQEDQEPIVEKLRGPLLSVRNEMMLPTERSFEAAVDSVESAFRTLVDLPGAGPASHGLSQPTELKLVQSTFTDKLICVKNSNQLKVIHRGQFSDELAIDHLSSFHDPPTSLESKITLRILSSLMPSFFVFLNWQSMFKENKAEAHFMGAIANVFTDMQGSSQFVPSKASGFIQFAVKLFEMKLFVDVASKHLKLAIQKQSRDLQDQSTTIKDRLQEHETFKLSFQPDKIPTLDDLQVAQSVLQDLQEQMWIQTRSNRSPNNVKDLMNSVSRPHSALNRLGSFSSFKLSQSPDEGINQLVDLGLIYKQSNQLCHSQAGNSKTQIQTLNYGALADRESQHKYFGTNNRMLNGLMTQNVELAKSLSYLVPQTTDREILDVIPSQNSEFALVTKPGGRVELYSTSINLSKVGEMFMFQSDGANAYKNFFAEIKKLNKEQDDSISCFKKIQAKTSKINFLEKTIEAELKEGTKEEEAEAKEDEVLPDSPPIMKKESSKIGINALIREEDDTKTPQAAEEAEAEKTVAVPAEEEAKEEKVKELNVDECEIYGYFLLTEPAHLRALDPVTVGCIFKELPSNKVFIRVKKLVYKLSYLMKFVYLDQDTGLFCNKFTDGYLTHGLLNKNQNVLQIFNQVLAQHHDQIVDLYTIFQRGEDAAKHDQIFEDVCQSDIEITDCATLVDFTRCKYSVLDQNQVHVLLKTTASETVVRQYSLQPVADSQEQTSLLPKDIQIVAGTEIALKDGREYKKIYQYDDKILLAAENGGKIFDISGKEVKDIEFGDSVDFKTLSIVNKTAKGELYSKANAEAKHKQSWHLVYKSKGSLVQHALVSEDGAKKEEAKEQEGSVLELSQHELMTILKDMRPVPLSFKAESAEDCNIYHHGFGSQRQLHSITVLATDAKEQRQADIRVNIKADSMDLETYRASELRVIQYLKVTDLGKVQSLLNSNEGQGATDLPSDQIVKFDKQSRPLPLVLEQWRGAQTNDTHKPSVITVDNQSVFCSNYPEPEYIFKHQHDRRFVLVSFTVKSQFNRNGWGIPIGRGYVFASENLEDIGAATRRFMNQLKLRSKEWEPKDQYIPSEPIGTFEMDKDMQVTVKVEPRYQRSYRFVKLVPFEFRKTPINYSRIKYNSKPSEITYFGVSGWELAEDEKYEPSDASQGHTLVYDSNSTTVRIGEQTLINEEKSLNLENVCVGATQASSDIIKILQKDNLAQYQPVFKLQLSFNLPEDAKDIALVVTPRSLSDYGLEVSSMTMEMHGTKLGDKFASLTGDAEAVFANFFKPIVESIATEKGDVFHLKFIKSVIANWKVHNKDLYTAFVAKIDGGLIESILKSCLELHEVEQNEVMSLLEALVDKNEPTFAEVFSKFVDEQLGNFIKVKQRQSTIQFVLGVVRVYLNDANRRESILKQMVALVSDEICKKELIEKEDKYKLHRQIKAYDASLEDILDGDLAHGEVKKQHRSDILLDMGNSGSSQLNTAQLTEVYKLNNILHFNLDFQRAFRVNKLKLFLLNEKDFQKLQHYKMRVIVSVPEEGYPVGDGSAADDEHSKPRFKVIYSQLFDENQLYQLNQLALKSSKDNTIQNKLTMDLDKGHQKNKQAGVLARYMTVQVQMLSMKSSKDSTQTSIDCLMFPQAYGLSTNEELPAQKSLDISAPVGDNLLAMVSFDQQQNLIYNIGEIEDIKQLVNADKKIFDSKTAVFGLRDETKLLETKEQFERTQSDLAALRKQIEKELDKKNDEEFLKELIGGFRIVKQNFSCYFGMSTVVTYDYLLKLRETLCEEILEQIKVQGMAAGDEASYKQLFYALLQCMILETIGGDAPAAPSGATADQRLMEFILSNISDHYMFYCELLNKYVIGSKADGGKDSSDKAYAVNKFLLSKSQSDLNQVLQLYENQFDCPYKPEPREVPLVEVYEMLLPKAVTRNKKQKPQLILQVIHLIKSIVTESRKIGMQTKFEVDAGHLLNLLAQHLIYCPKIKFQALSPSLGTTHQNSIQITTQIVLSGLDTLILFMRSSNVTANFDLQKNRFEITTLILAILLLEDQKSRQSAIKSLMKIAESDPDGVVFSIIDEFIREGKALYKNRSQSAMMRDVIDLIGIQLEQAKKLMVRIENLKQDEDSVEQSKQQHKQTIASIKSVITNMLQNMNSQAEQNQLNTGLLKDQWLKFFEIISQTSFFSTTQGSQESQDSDNLIQRFHAYFLDYSAAKGLSQQEQICRESIQLSVYPTFIQHLQKELNSSKKSSVPDHKSKVVDVLLEILDILVNTSDQEFHQIQFEYASGILSLLQSDGEKLQDTSIATLNLCQLEDLSLKKETEQRSKIKNTIKIKLDERNLQKLMGVFSRFLKAKLKWTSRFYDKQCTKFTMQKLTVANQMISTIEWADQLVGGEKKDEKLQLSAYQDMVMREELPHDFLEDHVGSILDWALRYKESTDALSQNRLVQEQARKLHCAMLSLLMKASPSESIYNLDEVKPEGRIRCLNVFLKALIERVEIIESQTLQQLRNQSVRNSQVLKNQENSNKTLMFFLKKWIVNDQIAQNFLREHNGLNFMLSRLLVEKKKEKAEGQIQEDVEDSVQVAEGDGVSSDESDLPEDFIDTAAPTLKTGASAPPPSADSDKITDAQYKNFTSSLKEQELGSIIDLVHTTDKRNIKANCNGYGGSLKMAFTQSVLTLKEYTMVFQIKGIPSAQISRLNFALTYQFSNSQLNMTQMPLFVMAEGGMKHANGKLTDVQWTVPLSLKPHDQALCNYFGNNVQCYALDFDQLEYSAVCDDQITDSSAKQTQAAFINKAKFIKITVRYPQTALKEIQQMYNFSASQMNYTYQFISCFGSTTAQNKEVIDMLTQIKKDSSMEMLSQFFQGEFSETFKSISSEPEIIAQFKILFSMLSELLESKEDLIKPIFLSMCQDNDELCNWVIKEQILNDNFSEVSKLQIVFLGDLIKSQKQPESFIQKMIVLRDYLFENVRKFATEAMTARDSAVVNKLFGILVNSMKDFASQFPKYGADQVQEVEFAEQDLMDLLKYQEKQSQYFATAQIQRPVMKLLACLLQSPKPFKNSSGINIDKAAVLLLGQQIEQLAHENKDASEEVLKEKVYQLPCMEILTTFASCSDSVYKLIQNVSVHSYHIDVIQVVIDKLLRKAPKQEGDRPEAARPSEQAGEAEVGDITISPSAFGGMFHEPDTEKEDAEKHKMRQDIEKRREQSTTLTNHLYKLSNNALFYSEYGRDLPSELYIKTIREKDDGGQKRTRVHADLEQEAIDQLVKIMSDLIMKSKEESSSSLQAVLKLLKEDLNNASNLDVEFIKQIIVPLLHAEEKSFIRLNFKLKEDQMDATNKDGEARMPIFWSKQGQNSEGADASNKKGINVKKYGKRPFFMDTDLLTDKMKESFEKAFVDYRKDSMPEVADMVKSEWQLLYQQTKEDKGNDSHPQSKQYWLNDGFKEMVEQCQDKTNFFLLCKGKQTVTTSGYNFQGEDVTIGCYSHNTFPQNVTSNWKHYSNYQIAHSPNNFFIVYSNSKMMHFEPRKPNSNPTGYLYTDGSNGGALIFHNNFLAISWSQDYRHMFGDVNYVTQLDSQKDQLRSQDFEPYEVQLWQYVPGIRLKQKQNLRKMYKMMPTFQRDLPLNFFSSNLVFEECHTKKLGLLLDEYLDSKEYKIANEEVANVGAEKENAQSEINNMTLKEFLALLKAAGKADSVIDIDVQAIEAKPEEEEKNKTDGKKDGKKEADEATYEHKPYFPILNKLEQEGGIVDLINVAIAVVNSYQSEKSRGTWSLWLEEIKSFIELPNFFTYFSQDYEKSQTIYKLIARNYDIDPKLKKEEVERLTKQYEKMYTEHVNYIYKIINEVFSKHTDKSLRDKCIQNGTYSKFLDRLSQLTGEKKRTKQSKDELKLPEKEEEFNDSSSAKSGSAQKSKETGTKKKKGVGYGGGSTTWNVAEYLQSKEAKNDQIAMIVSIIMQSIKEKPDEAAVADDQEEKGQIITDSTKIDMKDIILESALLPILEQAMRSGSLLEMAKQAQLYNVYLDLIVELAQNKKYINLLDKIGQQYVPEQKNSIQDLLEKVAGQSQIFVNALSGKNQVESKGKESDDDKKSKALAERIIKTEEIVKSRMKETLRKEHSLKLQSLASLPLSNAYTELLAPLRFDYMSMKKNVGDKNYDHVHNNDVQANPNPSQSKIIRLAQEIADLSNSLPCEPTNAMFCRVEKGRVDLMKIMIMGAAGTPYAHGAFVYDLFFPDTYPNNAPKCLLVTTGGGQVRFNPNLYSQGKVCLSLLGTWGGSNTETWDPKLSTILQLVMSIQAIIMSNEVYFNEPGYEHEMSTPAGEKKNTGYSNIVKYCNVKYAIIEAIKSPPKGFEKVIRRNFFLKRQMILEEVKEWCEQAKDEANATYTGLVSSHNNNWASKLSQPGAYKKMMDEIYKELVTTLNSIKNPFEEDDDIMDDVKKAVEKSVNKPVADKKQIGKLQVKGENLEEIDVSYKQPKELAADDQKIDIQDDKVKDRWSRYIGAMGLEAVAKQAESRVLLCDMGALSVEIAKNIVLAGCKELVIFEKVIPTSLSVAANIASGQFFLSDQEKEQSLALQTKHKLQELNHYVKVTVVKDKKYATALEYLKAQKAEKAEPFRAVVHTEYYPQVQEHLIKEVVESSKFCRAENIPFIWAYVAGCSAKIFTDFGAKFRVLETSAEEIPDAMIAKIERVGSKEEAPKEEEKKLALVTLIDGFVHQFQEGDRLKIEEVNGMKSLKEAEAAAEEGQIDSSTHKGEGSKTGSINGEEFVVVNVVNKQKFQIELDVDQYSEYEGSGVAKYQKTPKIVEFKSLEEYMQIYEKFINDYQEKGPDALSMDKIFEVQGQAGFFDENLIWADFEKLQEIQLTDFLIASQIDNRPKDDDDDDSGEKEEAGVGFDPVGVYADLIKKEKNADDKKKLANTLFKILYMHDESLNVNLAPLCAFLGGVVAQEIVKAMTQKFMPIKQVAYVTCSELVEDATFEDADLDDKILVAIADKIEKRLYAQEDEDLPERQVSQIRLLGKDMHEKIKNCKLFMIGAGAIGCELLKNYAMLGLGTGDNGHIILTDPDVIEVSNLNRQFLFREQHLRKPKSSTAAAAAIQMNKALKGHILARLDKIHDETADIYSEEFYENQTIVTNALDNVKARLYIDGKCVQARVPMIDSGTLGPKGHVQVVIPFKTESYASQKDPEQSNEIPYCTLKMFPEETLHCVEWAKDLFDNWFTLDSQSFNKFLIADLDQQDFGNSQTKEIAKKFIKMDQKRPTTFRDCLEKARKKFQSLYVNQILQLLHTYPLDKETAEGRPFWSLPKRPPRPIDFDPTNEVHATFIGAYACLLAGIYKIDFTAEADLLDGDRNPRSQESRKRMAEVAATFEVKAFVPDDEKAKQIELEVSKAAGGTEPEEPDKAEGSSLAQDDQKEIEEIQTKIQQVRERLFGDTKEKIDEKVQKQAELKVEEFEKDEDENFHIDVIYSMANIRAANYSLAYMDWITVKIKAGRIVPALATTTAAIAGLQTIEMLKIIKGIELEKQKNSFLNLAVPSLMMGEPGAPEKFKLTDELSVNLWDRWEYEKATPKTTLLDVIQHIDKIHKGKLEFRDLFQGAKPLFIYSLGMTMMKVHKLTKIEESPELNKSILELTGTSPKEMETQKFIDLTITFSLKKEEAKEGEAAEGDEEYQILKNVPDVRVCFGEEKGSVAKGAAESEDELGGLFADDDDY